MQRLENITQEEMPEVVRVASQLYESDQESVEKREEAASQAKAAVDAAEELGMPREYLERAAEVVQQRRIERVKRARKTRFGMLATLGAVVVLWGGWTVLNPAPPEPVSYSMVAPATAWQLDANAETRASAEVQTVDGKQAAVIRVEKFVAGTNGLYWANYDGTFKPKSLAGQKSVTFSTKGTGLRNVRLFLEATPTERWRSRAIPVTSAWQQHRLSLADFDHQKRARPSGEWRISGRSTPGEIERFSFKLGSFVNDASASGEVAISDLELGPK